MGKYKDFKYMMGDKVTSLVTFDKVTGEPSIINYTNDVIDSFLGKLPCTIDNIILMMKERCFDENRPDRDLLLRSIGLSTYDPYSICLATKGRMGSDNYWIDFLE